MSAGAVFKLIANDGKADRMIMATKLLNQRIKDVMCARSSAGKADVTPTLVDLERTHILYVNAHFKPFAAIGYEYNKVRPQSGNPTLGGGVTFSIPQFGDFFHDMVCRTRLSAIEASAGTTPVQANGAAGSPSVFPINGFNTTGGAAVGRFYNIVGADGRLLVAGGAVIPAPAGIAYQNLVRYCEYPGNRLFDNVKFDVNGNPLDQYDFMVPTMLEKFCIMPGKRAGYDRLVGQEVALTGYGGIRMGSVTDADATNTPQGITKFSQTQSNQTVGLFAQAAVLAGANGIAATNMNNVTLNANTVAGATFATQFDVSRQLQTVVNGPQTPKPQQAPLELWNKLRFWFNDDVRLSIASVSIPFGQRYITIELTQQANLIFEFPSIYLETIQDPINTVTANAVGGVAAGSAVTRTYSYNPIFVANGIASTINIEKMELYINNIFVNPEVHDIYIKRIGFSLIRVYREQISRCNASGADERLLSQLKWPVEYMFVGLRPVWNIKPVLGSTGGVVAAASGNQNMWRDWHRLTKLVDVQAGLTDQSVLPNGTVPAGAGSAVGQVMPDQYWLPVPTVDQMSLTSHGIVIFDGFSDNFFNQYLPFHYGGTALNTPDDPGAMFINMALFPRSYQPSGHLNISRARETYLQWTSSYISANSPADLFVVAVAINFLLITDGSAVLRYST